MKCGEAIITALPAFFAALGALIVALRGVQVGKETHEIVNSRMDQLVATTSAAAFQKGKDAKPNG